MNKTTLILQKILNKFPYIDYIQWTYCCWETNCLQKALGLTMLSIIILGQFGCNCHSRDLISSIVRAKTYNGSCDLKMVHEIVWTGHHIFWLWLACYSGIIWCLNSTFDLNSQQRMYILPMLAFKFFLSAGKASLCLL